MSLGFHSTVTMYAIALGNQGNFVVIVIAKNAFCTKSNFIIEVVDPGGAGVLGKRAPFWIQFFHFYALFGENYTQ